jgi:hypothetical protein
VNDRLTDLFEIVVGAGPRGHCVVSNGCTQYE